jgi:periplasmic protein TonB
MTDKGLSYAIGASILLHGLAIGLGATGKVPAQETPRLLEARLVREVIPEKKPEMPRVESPPRHVMPEPPRPLKAPVRHEPVAAPQPRLVAEARSDHPAPAIQTAPAATVAPTVAHAPVVSAPPVSSPAPAAHATSGAGFSPPSFGAGYLDNPKPGYPLMARRRGLEGTVRLDVRVSAEGIPTSVKLKESAGHESLDEAAIVAVWHWRFVPARRGGESVEASVVVPVRFRLGGDDAG